MNNSWGKMERLSRQDIERLQEKRLHHFLNRYVYPFSPFYRRLFDANHIDPKKIRRLEDLKHIPFTSKKDFISESPGEKFREFILSPTEELIRESWPLGWLLALKALGLFKGKEALQQRLEQGFSPVFMTFTTGTTHRPVSYLYTPYDIHNLSISGARMVEVFGMKKDDRLMNMFPYAPHLAFWQVVLGGFAARKFMLSTGGGKVIGTEGHLTALQMFKPTVILGMPSYVYHVLRLAKERRLRLPFLRRIVLGADRVSLSFKVRLSTLLSEMDAREVSIMGTYGFTEARCAWGECPTKKNISSGYHLYPDKEIFEIIDPKTGEGKQPQEDGEIVYTSLDSRGSSVVRYRTGDFVRGGITYEPCPYCGRTVVRLSSDITRLSDIRDIQLTKIKGSLVNLANFTATLSTFDQIEEWQIELRKKNNDPFEIDEVLLYISTRGAYDEPTLKESLKSTLLLKTEVTPNEIIVVPLPEMIQRLELETSGKEKRILDLRARN